jgi:thiosulfate/3-mercaptopyruvate sulfurtransferase
MSHLVQTTPITPTTLNPVVSASELLAALAADPQIVLIDTRFDLADVGAGEAAWRAGHPPGAQYLHLDRDLCGAKFRADGSFAGRHPLPTRAAFAATLGRCGIGPTARVVAFDAQGGMYAARLWWMLRWMGHADAAVLDGGLAAWVAAGGALAIEPLDAPAPATASAPYPEREPLTASIEAAELAAELGRRRLIDARAGERFRGEVEPLDTTAGHIPGASNRFFKDNLMADGRFKPAAELRREFDALLGALPADRTVHQCGSGVTACHNLLAMEHAGLAGSALYPGSWSEWSADPTRPVARG